MVSIEVPEGALVQNEVAYVHCGDEHLKSEVIKIRGNTANLQVFEDTRGIAPGQDVELTGELLSCELGPGLLGMIYDGLQNPLRLLDNRQGFFLKRGQYLPAIDQAKKWKFTPTAKPGDIVRAGSFLGSVQERHFPHQIMTPLGLIGTATVELVRPEGEYSVRDEIAVLKDEAGKKTTVTMSQPWPVKKAMKAYAERLYPEEMMVSGVRIIDTFFPVGRGGVACVPGPFGAGKTVLQHILSKYAQVDIVIVVACGERAGEVVELIDEFPHLTDPKTGGSLMDRTIIICNTSSMPVAARDASVYTGVTLAEYYRQMGRDVLLLADSTSRWAQAMREMSGRLEEIPGEEAFPAYLESRVANFYERAGFVQLHSGDKGAVTIVGAVSPAGGNFEEPVTQATLKVVSAFHGLSRKRSDERRFPAIDPLDSWSLYLKQLEASLNSRLDPKWVEMVTFCTSTLRKSAEIGRMMTVVGEEGVSLDDLVVYLKGEMLDAVYLQQNAFDDVDQATPIDRQVKDFKLVYRALFAPFSFKIKSDARRFFARLQDAFYQKNYTREGSAEHKGYLETIEKLLVEGSAA
ncbi:MAG: V-type ATP synthase subunit A [Myxococcota bacterium]|nr:V-type ATP synthase subunit A [Myxococcota bacterium]